MARSNFQDSQAPCKRRRWLATTCTCRSTNFMRGSDPYSSVKVDKNCENDTSAGIARALSPLETWDIKRSTKVTSIRWIFFNNKAGSEITWHSFKWISKKSSCLTVSEISYLPELGNLGLMPSHTSDRERDYGGAIFTVVNKSTDNFSRHPVLLVYK